MCKLGSILNRYLGLPSSYAVAVMTYVEPASCRVWDIFTICRPLFNCKVTALELRLVVKEMGVMPFGCT